MDCGTRDYTGQIPEISLGSIADHTLHIAISAPKMLYKNGVSNLQPKICNREVYFFPGASAKKSPSTRFVVSSSMLSLIITSSPRTSMMTAPSSVIHA